MRRIILLCENGEGFAKKENNNNLRSRLLTCPLTRPLMRLRLRAIDSAECRIINFDDILQLAKSDENFSFVINSASCKINVEFYILITF
jgi:hypothetical protein